jgi:putative Mg2+ transporter-C (MgtC) family protein
MMAPDFQLRNAPLGRPGAAQIAISYNISGMQPISFDWHFLWMCLMKIGIAWVLVMPTGWWSERQGSAVGVRTFPIVAMASCGYLMILSIDNGDGSRVLQGLIAGIGFVGGGAIVRDGTSVHGTATAASIWTAGAIGAAVALGRVEVALVLSVMNVLTIGALVPLKKYLDIRQEEEDGGSRRSANTE